MLGADAINKTGFDKGTSSDLSAALMDPSSASPLDTTLTSTLQSSVEKDVLQGPSDLMPTTLTTSSSSPQDLSSAADPAQPSSPKVTRDVMNIESMSTDDDTEEDKAFLSTLRDEQDPQKVWEYCRKHIHELGATIDPTIALEENVDEDMCLILVPQSHRMQEYFNDLAYLGEIIRVLDRRFCILFDTGRWKDDRHRQMSAHSMIYRIITFMKDVVEREQGFGKYAEEVVYDFEDERCDHDGIPFFTIEDDDNVEDDGYGEEEDGHDDHEGVQE